MEADGFHDQGDATRGDGLTTVGDHLGDGGCVEALEGLAGLGLAEATADELFFVGHNAEILVLLLHALFFMLVEPVAEAVVILVAQLGIELLVVEVPGAGVVDVVHAETEPATVAGVVGEEALLVAGGAERGQALMTPGSNTT